MISSFIKVLEELYSIFFNSDKATVFAQTCLTDVYVTTFTAKYLLDI